MPVENVPNIAPELMAILRCPRCRGELVTEPAALVCGRCRLAFAVVDGVANFLLEDARVVPDGDPRLDEGGR